MFYHFADNNVFIYSTVSIDLDNIVTQATNKVRIEADTKVSNIGRELQKQTEMLENVSAQLADLKEFTKELLTVIHQYAEFF